MMRAVPLLFGIFSVSVVAQPPGHLRGARPTTDEECKALPGINTALPIVFDDTCPDQCCFEDKPCRYCNEGCEGRGACAAATPAPTEDRLPACFGFPYVDNDCGHSSLGCYPDLRCLDAATYGCTEDAAQHPDWEVCRVCAKPGDANAAGYDECPTEPVQPLPPPAPAPSPSLPACFGFPYVDNDCGHSSLGCYPDLRCLDAATYGCTEDAANYPGWEVCKVCAKPGDANAAGYDECPTEPVQPGPSLPACFGFPYVDNNCGHSSLGCYPDLRCLDAATYGCTEDAAQHPDWEVCRVCTKPGDANAAGYDECPTEPVQPLPAV